MHVLIRVRSLIKFPVFQFLPFQKKNVIKKSNRTILDHLWDIQIKGMKIDSNSLVYIENRRYVDKLKLFWAQKPSKENRIVWVFANIYLEQIAYILPLWLFWFNEAWSSIELGLKFYVLVHRGTTALFSISLCTVFQKFTTKSIFHFPQRLKKWTKQWSE